MCYDKADNLLNAKVGCFFIVFYAKLLLCLKEDLHLLSYW